MVCSWTADHSQPRIVDTLSMFGGMIAFPSAIGRIGPAFVRADLWHQKTRVPELSCGFVCVILCVAVLVEHRLVTDTDRHRRTQGHSIYRAIIASRGKNWMFMVYNSTNERVGWVRTTSSEVKHAYCIRRKCTVSPFSWLVSCLYSESCVKFTTAKTNNLTMFSAAEVSVALS